MMSGSDRIMAMLSAPPPALPGESAMDYRLFVEYWRSGGKALQRELKNVVGCSRATVTRAAKRWRWDERISGALEAAAAESPADAAAWARRREEVRQREWELHREVVALAMEGIRRWKAAQATPGLAEIGKMMELASKLGRLGTNLGTEPDGAAEDGRASLRLDFQAALLKVYGQQRKEVEAGPVVDVECAARMVEG